MKILILCNKSPYPAKEGGPIAMNMIVEGLIRAGHAVRVLAMNTNKYHINPEEIPEEYRKMTRIELIFVDLRFNPVKALMNLFTGRSFHVERFISGSYDQKLKEILLSEKYDVVQFEMPYMSPYLETVRKYSKAITVLRAHNIEHLIWERIANQEGNPVKKIYLKHLAKTLKNHELRVISEFSGVAAITRNDADFFLAAGCRAPVIDIPFGIDLSKYAFSEPSSPEITLFSIGSMNWIPNQEGIRWFLDQAWPLIHESHPDLKFRIAGREMPAWLLESRYPGVEVVGEVEDAARFINENAMMIVPLFSGSGIRIKIIEGMACGKTIISTTIGAEGIHCTHGDNILIADTPVEFLHAVSECIQNPGLIRKIGQRARELIKNEYDRDLLIGKLVGFYQNIS